VVDQLSAEDSAMLAAFMGVDVQARDGLEFLGWPLARRAARAPGAPKSPISFWSERMRRRGNRGQ
jgi:hypothetical protein